MKIKYNKYKQQNERICLGIRKLIIEKLTKSLSKVQKMV